MIDLAVALLLAHVCGPSVAPNTLVALAEAESGFQPLAIGVNQAPHHSLRPPTLDAAVAAAENLIAKGRDVDLGLTQINVRNLAPLGLSLAQAFDPCQNLSGGARILTRDYLAARRSAPTDQGALQAALSAYNTGDFARGLTNGYVARVYRAAHIVPALAAVDPSPARPPVLGVSPLNRPAKSDPLASPAKPLDVFARGASASLVWADGGPTATALSSASPTPSRPGDPS